MTDVGEAEEMSSGPSTAPAVAPTAAASSRKRERLADEVSLGGVNGSGGSGGANGENNNVPDESSKKTHYQPQTVSVGSDMDGPHAQGKE